MEAQLLEKGIMGLVILAQMLAIKKLYSDLGKSRQDALDTLERVLSANSPGSKKPSSDS